MQKKDNRKLDERMYELAIYFARMWGVAETLEPLPHMDFKKVRDTVIEWAVECVDDQEEDFVKFFQNKIKEKRNN